MGYWQEKTDISCRPILLMIMAQKDVCPRRCGVAIVDQILYITGITTWVVVKFRFGTDLGDKLFFGHKLATPFLCRLLERYGLYLLVAKYGIPLYL